MPKPSIELRPQRKQWFKLT